MARTRCGESGGATGREEDGGEGGKFRHGGLVVCSIARNLPMDRTHDTWQLKPAHCHGAASLCYVPARVFCSRQM